MQLSEPRECAVRRSLTIYDEYVDQGVSGSKESRPALNETQILKPIKSAPFQSSRKMVRKMVKQRRPHFRKQHRGKDNCRYFSYVFQVRDW